MTQEQFQDALIHNRKGISECIAKEYYEAKDDCRCDGI